MERESSSNREEGNEQRKAEISERIAQLRFEISALEESLDNQGERRDLSNSVVRHFREDLPQNEADFKMLISDMDNLKEEISKRESELGDLNKELQNLG